MNEIITRVEVENRIMTVSDALEDRTEEYERLCKAAALAEAEYRKQHASMILRIANAADRKMTVDERTARADMASEEEHRTFLITTASRNSCRESLTSLRSQLDALRSLCANVRALS